MTKSKITDELLDIGSITSVVRPFGKISSQIFPEPSIFLNTESGNRITTEAGDFIVTEETTYG